MIEWEKIGKHTASKHIDKEYLEGNWNGKKILNLCAGLRPIKNATNTDIHKYRQDYIQWDINKRSPFKDNEFDLILGIGAINYIQPTNFIKFIEELHRITKKDGILRIGGNTTKTHKSMILLPFKIHPNDMRIFTTNDPYSWQTKAKYKIIKEWHDSFLVRYAKTMNWELQTIKWT